MTDRRQRPVQPGKGDHLEVHWTNFPKDGIHTRRFRRMGALIEWLDVNPKMQETTVLLKVMPGE